VFVGFLAHAVAERISEYDVDIPIEEAFKFTVDVHQCAMPCAGSQVHCDVDITVGSEVVADGRTEYSKAAHCVAPRDSAQTRP
jgi:hypothetical protein